MSKDHSKRAEKLQKLLQKRLQKGANVDRLVEILNTVEESSSA